METITQEILNKIYAKRLENSRKYDFGYLLVVGGSEYYTGAPALSAFAAQAAGIDMVRVVAPKRASDIIAGFSPTLAATCLQGDRLCKDNLNALSEAVMAVKAVSGGKCAVLIGGGIGRSPDTMAAVREFISKTDVSTVIDADAISAISEDIEMLMGKPLLITPHLTEFYNLTGNKVNDLSDDEKSEIVANQAKNMGVTIVLKGKTDIISNGERTALGMTGNALMTRAGTGDTLAGITGALLARGIGLFDSACAAAYINGAAGDLAGAKYGESLSALNLIDEIHNVLPKFDY